MDWLMAAGIIYLAIGLFVASIVIWNRYDEINFLQFCVVVLAGVVFWPWLMLIEIRHWRERPW